MTATDELRRLLDERGIEHMDFNMPERSLTLFAGDEHDGAYTENSVDTILTVYGASPEQAVEVTLGRGTCRITVEDNLAETEGTGDVWLECSACHWQMPLEPTPPRFDYCPPLFSYCPNCGRRIEVDA